MGRYTSKYRSKFPKIITKGYKLTDRGSNSSDQTYGSSKESVDILRMSPSDSRGSSDGASNDPYLDVKMCDYRSRKIGSVLREAKHLRHFLNMELKLSSDSGVSDSSSDDGQLDSREALFPGLPALPGPAPNPPPPTPTTPLVTTLKSRFERNKETKAERLKETKPLLAARKTSNNSVARKTINTLIQDLNNNSHEVITRARDKPRAPTDQAKTFPARSIMPNILSRTEPRFRSSEARLENGGSITQLIDQVKSHRALANTTTRCTKSWIEIRNKLLNREMNTRPINLSTTGAWGAKPAAGRPETHVVNVPCPTPRCTLNASPVVITLADGGDPPLAKDKRPPTEAGRRAGGRAADGPLLFAPTGPRVSLLNAGFLPPIVDRWQAGARRAVPSLVDRQASGDGHRDRPDLAYGRSAAPRDSASRLPPIKIARWERPPPPDAASKPPPRPGAAPGAGAATPRLPLIPGAAPRANAQAHARARPNDAPLLLGGLSSTRQPALLSVKKIFL